MKYRRELALLISAVAGMVAVVVPAPKPGFVMADVGAPMQFAIPARAENAADRDETMIALHYQANAALANLKAAGARK